MVAGVAYYGQRRYAEGVQMLSRLVATPRAPIFVGLRALCYGCRATGRGMRGAPPRELEDRCSLAASTISLIWAPLAIQIGLSDIPVDTTEESAARERPAPGYTVRAILGCFLSQKRCTSHRRSTARIATCSVGRASRGSSTPVFAGQTWLQSFLICLFPNGPGAVPQEVLGQERHT